MRKHPALRHAVKLLGSLLLLGGFVQSCSKPDTILLVNVDADSSLTSVSQLKVRVLVGETVSQFSVPTTPAGPITFPTSFTVQIARSNFGAVNVTITATGGGKTAMGTTSLPSLDVGNENVVNVHLGVAATPDGGVDSGTGTDGGIDAPTDRGTDVPGDTAHAEVSSDVAGSDALDTGSLGGSGMGGSGMGGSGMGGSGMGGSGMGGSGMGGSGMGGSGMGGSGMGGSGMGGSGMGGSGMGGSGMGGDMGTAGDAGTDTSDASDATDTSDADPDAPMDV